MHFLTGKSHVLQSGIPESTVVYAFPGLPVASPMSMADIGWPPVVTVLYDTTLVAIGTCTGIADNPSRAGVCSRTTTSVTETR